MPNRMPSRMTNRRFPKISDDLWTLLLVLVMLVIFYLMMDAVITAPAPTGILER